MDGPECVLGWGAVDDEGGTGTPDDPKWTARETRWKEVLWITWFCLYLSLYLYPYPNCGESRGLASGGVSLPFRLPLPLPLPFPLPLGGAPIGWGKSAS